MNREYRIEINKDDDVDIHYAYVNVGENILDHITRYIVDFGLNRITLCEVPECEGCETDQPNQQAHMNYPNGCLCDYSDFD
jgi:hypothetical protein